MSEEEIITVANITGKVIDDFEILEKFAGGAFSVVHFARHIQTNYYCAAKIVDLGAQSNKSFRDIMREVSVFMQVDHPHICPLFRLSLVNKILIFFMEYEINGTLLNHINKTGGLNEEEAKRIFSQLYDALRHVHVFHFLAHRDLKLENILLDKDNNVKLIDFGLSGTFYCNILKSFVGTPGYTPPEIVAGNEYGESCDVWSLGVCLYMILTDYLPFTNQSHDYKAIIEESEAIKFPYTFSPALQDLLKQMLQPRPDRRISIMNIQNHPWMRGAINTIAGNITPTPIVFYQINGYNDILKFKRKSITNPDNELLQKTADLMMTNTETVAQMLKNGQINETTTIYFMARDPLTEKPTPPSAQGLPPLKKGPQKRARKTDFGELNRIATNQKQQIRRQSVGPKQNVRIARPM